VPAAPGLFLLAMAGEFFPGPVSLNNQYTALLKNIQEKKSLEVFCAALFTLK